MTRDEAELETRLCSSSHTHSRQLLACDFDRRVISPEFRLSNSLCSAVQLSKQSSETEEEAAVRITGMIFVVNKMFLPWSDARKPRPSLQNPISTLGIYSLSDCHLSHPFLPVIARILSAICIWPKRDVKSSVSEPRSPLRDG